MSSSEPRASPSLLPLLLAISGLLLALGVVGHLYVRPMLARRRSPPVSEVKQHLKALYLSERSWFMERDAYSEDLAQVGFMPEPGHRYSYFSAPRERALPMSERQRPRAPFQVVPADPRALDYRGAFTSFEDTGCPLTPVTLPDGGTAGLGVTVVGASPSEAVFIGAAAANLDDDATVDCWSIATVARVAADGTRIPEGVPHNEVDDVAR
jgi:hypothetical protein